MRPAHRGRGWGVTAPDVAAVRLTDGRVFDLLDPRPLRPGDRFEARERLPESARPPPERGCRVVVLGDAVVFSCSRGGGLDGPPLAPAKLFRFDPNIHAVVP